MLDAIFSLQNCDIFNVINNLNFVKAQNSCRKVFYTVIDMSVSEYVNIID